MTMRCTRELTPQLLARPFMTMTKTKTVSQPMWLVLLLLVLMMTSLTMMPVAAGIELQAADEGEATNTLEQRVEGNNNTSDAFPRQYPSGIPGIGGGGGGALPGYGGFGGIGGGVPSFAGAPPGAGGFNGAAQPGVGFGGYPGGFPAGMGMGMGGPVGGGVAPGCPLCDASVYGYCSHKMVHDACCCDFSVQQTRPQQCLYYDCSLLYAKSCYEHALIKNCCCNNPY